MTPLAPRPGTRWLVTVPLGLLGLLGLGPLAGCGSGSSADAIALKADQDRDGLPDALERSLGSDPRDPNSPTPSGQLDSDTPQGPGPDGVTDGMESYLLSRGVGAPITCRNDTDGDQIPDYLELRYGLDPFDRNNPVEGGQLDKENESGPALDGISDGLESFLLRLGGSPPMTRTSDSDGDGIPDVVEALSGSRPDEATDPAYGRAFDLDRDGLPDWLEVAEGSNPLDPNFPVFDGADDDDGGLSGPDGDGVSDGLEGWLVRGGAAAPVTRLTDTDGDGLPDVAEILGSGDPFDADDPVLQGGVDSDGDGLSDALEFVLHLKGATLTTRSSDSDGDRLADWIEVLTGSDPFDAATPSLFSHFDLDGDGVVDFLELADGFDPLDPDDPRVNGGQDLDDPGGPAHDLISDALEELMLRRGFPAPVSAAGDADGDGVSDFIELHLVSDPFDADSPLRAGGLDTDDSSGPPGDGLSDAAEHVLIALGAVGPVDTTTRSDEDAIPDAIELASGSNPLDLHSPPANHQPDIDGDGAPDFLEHAQGSDPYDGDDPLPGGGADSDGDGLSDALELLLAAAGLQQPVTPTTDSDGDGLADYLEIRLASFPLDPDRPVLDGGADRIGFTGPPGDGLSDALEYYLVESGAARPITTSTDSDADVVPDYLELRLALDPFDPDSPLLDGSRDDDGDAISNALELVLENLGATPPVSLLSDSDDDGAPDALEVFAGLDPFDADVPLTGGRQDGDADGLPDALEIALVALGGQDPITPLSDTDRDGITDAYEYVSGTHPVRGDHPLPNGGADVNDDTGPLDRISDGLEALLISQGAQAPITYSSDSDLDGAPDHLEVLALGDPFSADSPLPGGQADQDADGLTDALEEVLARLGAERPVEPDSDTDGDGAPDWLEVRAVSHPLDPDVPILEGDGDHFDIDPATGRDGDGISDALELLLVRLGCTPPILTTSDFDQDGLPDYFEARSGTDPVDGDSPLTNGGADDDNGTGPPGDGISDALEALLLARGASGPITLSTDTDGDGVPDFYEVFLGSDPFDAGSTIPAGSAPTAVELAVVGPAIEGRTVIGSYRYVDADLDAEGPTRFRWLRDGLEVPGAITRQYLLGAEDLGTTLTFEVTPVSDLAWPPETLEGAPAAGARLMSTPDYDRGIGGPGGIGKTDGSSSLRLWLRTGLGLDEVGEARELVAWHDASGSGRDSFEVSSSNRPEIVDGVGPRARTVVRFDGDTHAQVLRPVADDFTLMAVFATTSTASDDNWWLAPTLLGGEQPAPCFNDFSLGLNGGRPMLAVEDHVLLGALPYANGSPHVIGATRDRFPGTAELFLDGREQDSAFAGLDSLTCPPVLYLGSSNESEGFWTGDVFEVLAFDRVLTRCERVLVENHLAAATGAQLARPRYAFAGGFAGDLAGIGRASADDQVTQAEGLGIVQISNPSALSDDDYLIWGVDRAEDFRLASDVPLPYPARLARTWAYTITDGGDGDGVGTVSLRFRVRELFLVGGAASFALLIDTDEDFHDARVHTTGARYQVSDDTITFTDVDLSDGSRFALAVTPR